MEEKLFLRGVDDGVGGGKEAGEGWGVGCGVDEELMWGGAQLVSGGGLGKGETRGLTGRGCGGSAGIASEKRIGWINDGKKQCRSAAGHRNS